NSYISPGAYVREGEPMFDVLLDDPVKFRAAVPERYIGDVQAGQSVLVSIEAYAEPFEGRVSRINPRVEPTSRTFQIEAIVPNADRRLPPGAFARGQVVIDPDRQMLSVPAAAVLSFAGIDRVFSIKEGKAA